MKAKTITPILDIGKHKKVKAYLMCAIFVLSQFLALFTPFVGSQTAYAASDQPGWDQVLGIDLNSFLKNLEAHKGKYLNTPYATNLARYGGPGVGMDCSSFLVFALKNEVGAKSIAPLAKYDPNGTGVSTPSPSTAGWVQWAKDNNMNVDYYKSFDEMLASGTLRKGDIVVASTSFKFPIGGASHLLIHWSDDPHENKAFHETTVKKAKGNIEGQYCQISNYIGKSGSKAIAVIHGTTIEDGSVEIVKSSSNGSISNGNPNYSLAGAKFGVFDGSKQIATLTTDENGRAKVNDIPKGNYTLRELTAPKGYAISNVSSNFTVEAGKTATVKVTDVPQNDPARIAVTKKDAETGAPLAGAQFTVKFYAGQYSSIDQLPASPSRTWVLKTNDKGVASIQHAYTDPANYFVSGDSFYMDASGNPTFPLGTVTIQETKAPEGYKADTNVYLRNITANGNVESVNTFNAPEVPNQIMRGDVSFSKINGETGERLGSIPFKVTNKATGESHILVTDANGMASTASSWNKHSVKTNANDAAVSGNTVDESKLNSSAGIWFSGSKTANAAKDNMGALPYGTYTFEELRTSKNEGLKLVSFDIVVTKDATTLDLGTVDDNPESSPAISTTATDGSGNKYVSAEGDVQIVDRVEYYELAQGKTYTVTGTLMDKATGKAVTNADGTPVTATKTFTAPARFGYVNITFNFDASKLAGHQLVVFEELSVNGKVTAEHRDWNDEGQSVTVDPSIRTTATNAETGEHFAKAETVTINDVVNYTGLIVGKTYKLSGTLMDKESGNPVLDSKGNVVTGTKEFVATQANGSETITFTFDASAYAGGKVVAFESLSEGKREVATHTDLTDEDQSVEIGPNVGTKIADAADGDQRIDPTVDQTLVDTVSYEGVKPGETYTVTGTLMNKATGEPVKDAQGKTITASQEFTPSEANGTVDVTFTFDATGLQGITVVAFEQLSTGGKVVGTHESIDDPDQSAVVNPKIGTVARTEDGKNVIDASNEDVKIIDTVKYQGAVIGETYEVVGTLMDKQGEQAVIGADGNPVTAKATFTAESVDGEVDVEFVFNARPYAGHDIVVFETMLVGDVVAATHEDPEAPSQTITVNPAISTKFTDALDGDQRVLAEGNQTIVDTVTYAGVKPGKTYVMTATLMDKATGEPYVDADGNPLTAEKEFTPEAENGTVEMGFTVDGTQLAGKYLVAFEKLSLDHVTVATHEDLGDEDQTLEFLPKIGTQLWNKDTTEKEIKPNESQTFVDTVAFEGAKPGQLYAFELALMDKDANEIIKDADGNEARVTVEYIPETTEGTVDIELGMDTTGLAGKNIVAFERMYERTYDQNLRPKDELVARHEDPESADQSVFVAAAIGTVLVEKETGGYWVQALPEVELVDTIKYEGFVVGETYTVKGVLMDKETEKPVVDANGNEVTAETTFTAEESAGEVEVTFTFDATKYAGKQLVAFETAYDAEGNVTADHSELGSYSQTVEVYPLIGTYAADKADGDKIVAYNSKVTIVDTVKYEGATPDQYYLLNAVLMDKSTGKAVTDASGNPVTNEISFVAKEANGSVDVELTFDTTGYAGRDLVVYEYLTKRGISDFGIVTDTVVAVHEDINDAGQTVTVENPPTSTFAKTGADATTLLAAGGIALASATAFGAHKLRNGKLASKPSKKDEGNENEPDQE